MNYILTGATGTLGSRILYELFIQKNAALDTVFLLTRSTKNASAQIRIERVLKSDNAPAYIKDNLQDILKKVHVVNEEDFLKPASFLTNNTNNHFIHSAGYVNLSTDPEKKNEIFEQNHEFSKRLFTKYTSYLQKFTYISTAFAIGDIGGTIGNDFLNHKAPKFRNFYEEAKLATEKFLVAEGDRLSIPIQILRPSVLGGNIIDTPNFFISKYMVFYLFAKFFYKTKSQDKIRIQIDSKTGLNVIPTDYAAKVIVKVLNQKITQLNIAHTTSTNQKNGIVKLLETVGYKNFSIVSNLDKNDKEENDYLSTLEAFYYNTIGIHLSPYLNSKPYQYDTELLEKILPIPKYDLQEYIASTVAYAKKKNFRNERW